MPPLSLKQYVDIAAALVVVGFLVWLSLHFYHKGEDAVRAADAKVIEAQRIHNEEVNRIVAVRLDDAVAVYRKQVAGPPLAPVHVSVCHASGSSPVVTDEPAPARGDGAADVSTALGQVRDIGPATDQLLEQADAQITLLQAYIQTCVDKGICRAL